MTVTENFLNISQETWEETLEAYRKLGRGGLSKYLQWYPLNHMAVSVRGYDEIKKGYFLFDKNVINVSENYLQKSDGSFRQAQLLSPTLYMVLESICRTIYQQVGNSFQRDFIYYSGDLQKNEVTYQNSYKNFTKNLDKASSRFSHYIKLDVKDFFRNINIDLLFEYITASTQAINPFYIDSYKRFLRFCGNDKFPVVENSVGLSYLATEIYLHKLDESTVEHLNNDTRILDYQIIRYVDDVYIFVNTDDESTLQKFFVDFKSFYQTQLRLLDMNLNQEKSQLKNSKKIHEDIYTMIYDIETNDELVPDHQIDIEKYIEFLKHLVDARDSERIVDRQKYLDIHQSVFSFPNTNYSANEVHNYLIYDKSQEFEIEEIINLLLELVGSEVYFYDIKRFTIAILNTKDEKLIKKFLNKLFNTEVWYDNESCAAINYLLNRTFRHADLKDRLYRSLESKNSKLYTYILEYCLLNRTVREEKLNYLLYFVKKANITPITMHLYYLYLFALKSKNIFNAHAYFKTFFDRITAEIQYYRQPNKKKKPSYKGYYRGHQLQKVYSDVGGTKDFFDELSRIRNGNPVIHGSCNLINENNTVNDLLESIEGMKNLVWNKIVSLEDELGMD